MSAPATQAVRKHAIVPATKALSATSEMSPFRSGASVPSAATCMPMAAGLEKPQRAYVVMILDLEEMNGVNWPSLWKAFRALMKLFTPRMEPMWERS